MAGARTKLLSIGGHNLRLTVGLEGSLVSTERTNLELIRRETQLYLPPLYIIIAYLSYLRSTYKTYLAIKRDSQFKKSRNRYSPM